jgi:hypothetical protein
MVFDLAVYGYICENDDDDLHDDRLFAVVAALPSPDCRSAKVSGRGLSDGRRAHGGWK